MTKPTGIPVGLDGKPVEQPSRSAFVEAYEARPRWMMTVDMAAVLGHAVTGHDGAELTKVCYRINTKSEDDSALAAAHAHAARVSKLAGAGGDELKGDGDILNDAKTLQALYRCCRDPRDPSKTLFPTPSWMAESLDTDILQGLLNGYNEARCRKSGQPWEIDDVTLDGTREMLVAAFDSELPERLLTPFTREYLATLLTLVCKRWDDDRRLAAAVMSELLRGGNAGAIKEAQQLAEEWGPDIESEPPDGDSNGPEPAAGRE